MWRSRWITSKKTAKKVEKRGFVDNPAVCGHFSGDTRGGGKKKRQAPPVFHPSESRLTCRTEATGISHPRGERRDLAPDRHPVALSESKKTLRAGIPVGGDGEFSLGKEDSSSPLLRPLQGQPHSDEAACQNRGLAPHLGRGEDPVFRTVPEARPVPGGLFHGRKDPAGVFSVGGNDQRQCKSPPHQFLVHQQLSFRKGNPDIGKEPSVPVPEFLVELQAEGPEEMRVRFARPLRGQVLPFPGGMVSSGVSIRRYGSWSALRSGEPKWCPRREPRYPPPRAGIARPGRL